MDKFIRRHPPTPPDRSLPDDLEDVAAIDGDDVNWAYVEELLRHAAHRIRELEASPDALDEQQP